MIRVVQTHTVGFEGLFLTRLGTLLPDPTPLGKPDFRSRTLIRRRTHSELGYLPIRLKSAQKYTVLYLELIRSLLDPFQVSHPIMVTSDSLRLTRNYPDSGYHPECSKKCTVLYLDLIRLLLDPFQMSHTIIETSDSFRLPRNYPDLGYHPECSEKYTVLYLDLIRSLLDPFQLSLTVIGTSDDREGYRGQYPPLFWLVHTLFLLLLLDCCLVLLLFSSVFLPVHFCVLYT